MIEPDEFGLSVPQTLARVADPTPHPEHSAFWNAWRAELSACEPELRAWAGPADPTDPSGTHHFESVRHVRCSAALWEPPEDVEPIGVLVTTHGSSVAEPLDRTGEAWSRVRRSGVAVLVVRVRGYPGSQLDCGDWLSEDSGWIARGLPEDASQVQELLRWSLPQAVADVANAARAARRWLGDDRPVALHGESFGGGLAVMAAAQAVSLVPIDRLVLALPTFGDWPWRLTHDAPGGTNREVAELMIRHADRAETLAQRLRLCDAVVHAHKVRCPVLCKLARRDEVVPAPTSAAIFNALGSDPGRKWRFLTAYGHFEGGIADARRHALFERAAAHFLRLNERPIDLMRAWEPLLSEGERPPEGLDRDPPHTQSALFDTGPTLEQSALVRAYEAGQRTLDDLPYTNEFEALFVAVDGSEHGGRYGPSRRDVFHALHTLRKAGKLPRLGRAASVPVKLEPDEERALTALVEAHAGKLSLRDRLPYTPEFDQIRERFTADTGRDLDGHTLWRLIAKLAK